MKKCVPFLVGPTGIGKTKLSDDSEKELLEASKQQDSAYIKILQEYLPKQADDAEVRAWIKENIDFSSFANKMQAMRPIMAHFGTTVDGAAVKKILQDIE